MRTLPEIVKSIPIFIRCFFLGHKYQSFGFFVEPFDPKFCERCGKIK